MNPQDNARKEAQETTAASSPAKDADKPAAGAEPQKPGLKYVFKIASADPKRNSIDFEDVADK